MDYLQMHEIYHHGIKGQRWGYRRYQNEDGSLTSAGKDRYGRFDSNGKTQDGIKNFKFDQKAIKGQRMYEKGIGNKEVEAKRKNINRGLLAGTILAAIGAASLGAIAKKNKRKMTKGENIVSKVLSYGAGAMAVGMFVNNRIAKKKQEQLKAFDKNGSQKLVEINKKKEE